MWYEITKIRYNYFSGRFSCGNLLTHEIKYRYWCKQRCCIYHIKSKVKRRSSWRSSQTYVLNVFFTRIFCMIWIKIQQCAISTNLRAKSRYILNLKKLSHSKFLSWWYFLANLIKSYRLHIISASIMRFPSIS